MRCDHYVVPVAQTCGNLCGSRGSTSRRRSDLICLEGVRESLHVDQSARLILTSNAPGTSVPGRP